MKLIITVIFSFFLFSQLSAQVSEREVELSLGMQYAFVQQHPNANEKMVSKIWEKKMKEYGKVKRNKKAKEWNCLGCTVPGISGTTNVYFKVEEGKGQTTSYTFFDDGTKFICSENAPEEASNLGKTLVHLSYAVETEVITKALEEEENNLKDRNKEQEKLEKKNQDLHKEIEKYEEKIAKAQREIEKNLEEQTKKKEEIEVQMGVVKGVTERLNSVGQN